MACTTPCALATYTRSGGEETIPWLSDSGALKSTWLSVGLFVPIWEGLTAGHWKAQEEGTAANSPGSMVPPIPPLPVLLLDDEVEVLDVVLPLPPQAAKAMEIRMGRKANVRRITRRAYRGSRGARLGIL